MAFVSLPGGFHFCAFWWHLDFHHIRRIQQIWLLKKTKGAMTLALSTTTQPFLTHLTQQCSMKQPHYNQASLSSSKVTELPSSSSSLAYYKQPSKSYFQSSAINQDFQCFLGVRFVFWRLRKRYKSCQWRPFFHLEFLGIKESNFYMTRDVWWSSWIVKGTTTMMHYLSIQFVMSAPLQNKNTLKRLKK